MATSSSSALFNHPALWRGKECAQVAIPSVPTGFAELDVLLPGGGWPAETITEIYAERSGIGEMQLLMPALARLTLNERWLMLITPPYIPYAPALAARGVRLSHVMLLRVQDIGMQLWACEQALRSGACGAALLWVDRIQERALRRVQLAAEGSGSIVMLFRGAKSVPVTSASLRLHLSKAESRTIVRILKRRGGGIPAPVALDLHGGVSHRSATTGLTAPSQHCTAPSGR
jgi:hypothetical protein